MFLKFLIGLLVFNGFLAVVFWLLVTCESKAADRKIEEAENGRDHAVDDRLLAQDTPPKDRRQTRSPWLTNR